MREAFRTCSRWKPCQRWRRTSSRPSSPVGIKLPSGAILRVSPTFTGGDGPCQTSSAMPTKPCETASGAAAAGMRNLPFSGS